MSIWIRRRGQGGRLWQFAVELPFWLIIPVIGVVLALLLPVLTPRGRPVDPKVAELLKTLNCHFAGRVPLSGRGYDSVKVPPGEAENEGAARVFLRLLAIKGDPPEAEAHLSRGATDSMYSVYFTRSELFLGAMDIFPTEIGYRVVLRFTDSPKEKGTPPIIQVVTMDDATAKELNDFFATAIAKKEAGEYQ